MDHSYPLLVDRAVEAQLLELAPPEHLISVGGQLAEQSAFAFPKDAVEDRWISCMEVANALVDPVKMRNKSFPYMSVYTT